MKNNRRKGNFTNEGNNNLDYASMNKDAVLLAVKKGVSLKHFRAFYGDRDIVMAAVQRNGLALECVPHNLQTEDQNIVLEAVKQNGMAVVYAKVRVGEVLLEAILQNPNAEVSLDGNDKDNLKNVILQKIQNQALSLRVIPQHLLKEALQDNFNAAQKIIEKNPFDIKYMHSDFWEDKTLYRNLVSQAFQQNADAVAPVLHQLPDDDDIIQKATIEYKRSQTNLSERAFHHTADREGRRYTLIIGENEEGVREEDMKHREQRIIDDLRGRQEINLVFYDATGDIYVKNNQTVKNLREIIESNPNKDYRAGAYELKQEIEDHVKTLRSKFRPEFYIEIPAKRTSFRSWFFQNTKKENTHELSKEILDRCLQDISWENVMSSGCNLADFFNKLQTELPEQCTFFLVGVAFKKEKEGIYCDGTLVNRESLVVDHGEPTELYKKIRNLQTNQEISTVLPQSIQDLAQDLFSPDKYSSMVQDVFRKKNDSAESIQEESFQILLDTIKFHENQCKNYISAGDYKQFCEYLEKYEHMSAINILKHAIHNSPENHRDVFVKHLLQQKPKLLYNQGVRNELLEYMKNRADRDLKSEINKSPDPKYQNKMNEVSENIINTVLSRVQKRLYSISGNDFVNKFIANSIDKTSKGAKMVLEKVPALRSASTNLNEWLEENGSGLIQAFLIPLEVFLNTQVNY